MVADIVSSVPLILNSTTGHSYYLVPSTSHPLNIYPNFIVSPPQFSNCTIPKRSPNQFHSAFFVFLILTTCSTHSDLLDFCHFKMFLQVGIQEDHKEIEPQYVLYSWNLKWYFLNGK
jgi:hypothetical protein